MNISFIILLSIFILIFIISIYWCFKHCNEYRNVNNNNTRWKLVKMLNKNPDVLPISKKNNEISLPSI